MSKTGYAVAAVIITHDGKAVSEPLYFGKDLLEIFPNAKSIKLFGTVTEAAYFAATYGKVDG